MRIRAICEYLERCGIQAVCPEVMADRQIERVASLESADAQALSFVSRADFLDALEQTRAGAVLIRPEWRQRVPEGVAGIEVNDPYAAYAFVAGRLHARPQPEAGIHASAQVHPEAMIEESVWIGPGVVIERGARIEAGCRIDANCYIGEGVHLGEGVRLEPGVIIYHDCEIGARTRIKAGAVIGSEGFGFAPYQGRWIPIPQIGRVVIGQRCSIGANTTIDRGALEDTRIGDDVILDNLVHIAHNVEVGEGTAMAAQTGIAGSARIGRHCQFAGQAGMPGHLTIADGVVIMAKSAPGGDIDTPGVYSGFPAMPHTTWKKVKLHQRRLPEIAREVRGLRKRLEALAARLEEEEEHRNKRDHD